MGISKINNRRIEKAGFEIMDEGIRALWNPDDDSKKECEEFGRKIETY